VRFEALLQSSPGFVVADKKSYGIGENGRKDSFPRVVGIVAHISILHSALRSLTRGCSSAPLRKVPEAEVGLERVLYNYR